MRSLVILGGGTAGTMAANLLRKRLDGDWRIVVVDRDDAHPYQPGFLFVPFWMRPARVVRNRWAQLVPGVEHRQAEVRRVEPDQRVVELSGGESLAYDWLVIASGSVPRHDLVPGLSDGPLWQTKIHDFYTLAGATALRDALATFTEGRLLIHLAELPIKCPVAPLEFAFLVEDHFRRRGLRHKVDITFVTPLDGAFTKPVSSRAFGQLLDDRSIRLAADFAVDHVNNETQHLVSYDGRELPFDLLVTVPPHTGAQFIMDSGMGNDMGFVPVDRETLRSLHHERIFVLGDANDIPTSKAGSVAHFATELFVDNFLAATRGAPLPNRFDGHANCFLESGRGEALLLDFNYDTEPLPGSYPLPAVGPLRLLTRSRVNHWGKLAFEFIYWHVLLPGRRLPVPLTMSMTGKRHPEES